MKNINTEPEVLVAKAIVWVAGKAIECVPVIGPMFQVVSFMSEVAEIRKAHLDEEQAIA